MGGRPVLRPDRVGHPGPRRAPGAAEGAAAAGPGSAPPGCLGERYLAEDLLDPAQVPHPGLGGTADPAADRLHRHAELAGRRFLGQSLPAQRDGHPLRERGGLARPAQRDRLGRARRRDSRGRGRVVGPARRAADRGKVAGPARGRSARPRPAWPGRAGRPGPAASPAWPGRLRWPGSWTGSGCRSGARPPRRAPGRSGTPPGSTRSARPRRGARGTRSRRPPGCPRR